MSESVRERNQSKGDKQREKSQLGGSQGKNQGACAWHLPGPKEKEQPIGGRASANQEKGTRQPALARIHPMVQRLRYFTDSTASTHAYILSDLDATSSTLFMRHYCYVLSVCM